MKVLDLFAGLEGWSEPFCDHGHEVCSVDIDERFDVTMHADILDLRAADLPWQPDLILASPPCEGFTVMNIGKNWTRPNEVPPHAPKTERARQALKLVQALLQESGRGAALLPHFIKVAAIGTLADVVPLIGENRVIASCGLDGLSIGPHGAGIEALLAESGLLGRVLDSFHVSFVLAPRLNAAGRMSSPDLAVDLLLMKGRGDAILAVKSVVIAKLRKYTVFSF